MKCGKSVAKKLLNLKNKNNKKDLRRGLFYLVIILHPEQGEDILEKMYDNTGGLSQLGALEFANAADTAAKQLYGADYRKRNVRPVATCAR